MRESEREALKEEKRKKNSCPFFSLSLSLLFFLLSFSLSTLSFFLSFQKNETKRFFGFFDPFCLEEEKSREL
jgi:hypothetical protein